MNKAVLRKMIWGILTPSVLMLAGCGKRAALTGRVTLDGQPVESGFVTFFPEDNQGTSVGVEIVQGQYSVPEIAAGKKRIFVNITEVAEPAQIDVAKSRNESNAERLAGARKKQGKSKQAAPAKLEGNNKIVTVGSGSQQIDIPLERQKSAK
jgi:hypothetical protein